ncbi:ergosterol biosynthesis ERG4/ERG24 [Sporodiniella umbellata]|nr:ergosterol biosynthesis ERG4/ERG24 [Sporodiniella umbellata]
MVLGLPVFVVFLACCCGPAGYPSFDLVKNFKSCIAAKLSTHYASSMFCFYDLILYCGFVTFVAFLYVNLPGRVINGTLLRDGTRIRYKINGLLTYVTLMTIACMVLSVTGLQPLTYVYDHYTGLVLSSILFAYTLSLFVYINSFYSNRLLALGGNTGNIIYDFMIGRELNPYLGSFDIKFFTELRGLLGWLAVNYCLATKQYIDLGYLSKSMFLVQLFHTWYVVDALWNEKAVLTTMDITTDGFGFMLAFGLYTWVPFTYTLQARYLVDFPYKISWFSFFAILLINTVGYICFRDLSYMETQSGTKLITSSWWGKARHINYFGDWLMALSWSLPCGFGSVVPYFYPLYFAVLLYHRERRDDCKCLKKYGDDWKRYSSIVPYRIIPGKPFFNFLSVGMFLTCQRCLLKL